MSATPLRIQILFESPSRASVQGVDDAIGTIDRSIQGAATRAESAIATAGQRMEATVIRVARVASVQLGTAFNQITGELNSLVKVMGQVDQMAARLSRLGVSSGSAPTPATPGLNLQSFLNDQIAKGFAPTGRGTIAANTAGVRASAEYLNSIGRRLTAAYNSKDELTSVKIGLQPNSDPDKDLSDLLQKTNLRSLGKIAGERSAFEEKYRTSVEKEVGDGIRRRAMEYADYLDGLDKALDQSQKDLAAELKAAASKGKREFTANDRIRAAIEQEVGEGIRQRAEDWSQYFAGLDQAKIDAQTEMMRELGSAGLKGKKDFASDQRQRDAVEKQVGEGIRARADDWARYFAGLDQAQADAQKSLMDELNVAGRQGKTDFALQQRQREQIEQQISSLNHGDSIRFLSGGKYKAIGARLGAGGQILTDYRNSLGSTATLNQETGELESKISLLDRLTSGWNKFSGAVQESDKDSTSAIDRIGSAMIRLSATIYSIERLSGLFKRVLIDPITDLTGAIIKADEASRKFEYAISGVAGGLSRSRELNRAIVDLSRNSPLSVEDLRESTQTLARTPALAVRLGLGSPADTAAEAERFASVVGRLGSLDPSQGSSGAQIAILNALQGGQGGLVSLRRRFGVSPQTLASLSGSTISELKNNPGKTLEGIEKFADTFIPEEAYRRTANLVSVRWQKLQDAVKFALAQVGDSGVFDSIGDRLKAISDQMFDYFGSADFQREAARISDSLDRVLGNVARSAEHLVRSITGAPTDLSSVSGAVATTGNVLDRIGRLSDNLPAIADKVGPAITDLARKVGAFIDAVIEIADAARDPVGFAKRVASGTAASRTGQDANAITLDALKRAGIDTNNIPTRFYTPGTNSEYNYKELRDQGASVPSAFAQFTLQAARDAIGSNVNSVEELDFHKLPIDQRILAQKIYAGAQQNGKLDSDLIRQLTSGQITHLAAAGTLPPRGDEDVTTSLVRKLVEREYKAPNFAALLQAANAGSSGLSELADQGQTSLERLRDVSDIFGKVQITKSDAVSFAELLKKIDDQFVEAKDVLEKAIVEGDRELTAAGDDQQLKAGVSELRKQRDRLLENYRKAIDTITQDKIEAVRDYGVSLNQSLSDFPAQAKVEAQRAIIAGTTSKAKEFEAIFGTPAGGPREAFGIGAMSLERAQKLYQSNLQNRLGAIQAAGQSGDILSLDPTASYEQIAALKPLTTTQMNRQMLQYLQGEGSQNARELLSRAQQEFTNHPDDTSLANVRSAQVDVAELRSRINRLTDDLNPLKKGFEEMSTSARDALEHGLGDAIYDLITGVGSLEDALRGFAQSIIRTFADIQARNIVQGLLGDFGQPQQNGGTAIAGGLIGSLLGGLIRGFAGGGTSMVGASLPYQPGALAVGAASGGIFPGGLMPLHAFANGGLVRAGHPVVGLVGEGRMNEAVVPLPSGDKIPVEFTGSASQPNVNVYIVRDEDEAFRSGFSRNKDILINEMQRQASKGKLSRLRR